MKKTVAYVLAILVHLAVLFGIAAPKPAPPVAAPEKQYIEVTLVSAPPPPAPLPELPPPPKAEPPPPPPPEPPPPLPELPPPPPPPPNEDLLPELTPEPPPPPQTSPPAEPLTSPTPPTLTAPIQTQPVANPMPASPVPGAYLNISQPSFLSRVQPDYPLTARRQHQQGEVRLGLYINELGSLDKVEIVKSSGYPLLDEAAVEAMKQSRFNPAYRDKTPVPSHAEVTISFQLE